MSLSRTLNLQDEFLPEKKLSQKINSFWTALNFLEKIFPTSGMTLELWLKIFPGSQIANPMESKYDRGMRQNVATMLQL